ncbi:hypothetical protein BPOR_0213g00030 [Botrytis porri]|uniref:Uncharacterized protein n=1 Tax=Botrytis porri TaxID=87229 RepID=A0A4Z1KRD9_9HELO|nr:hypothetical protein BPOR_0213g00030 [Botrytis porri]
MEIHRKFTDKVKTYPKYFQMFLIVLVVTFIITILVVGSVSEPGRLLQLYAPSEEFDLYRVYFFKVCRSKIDGINDGCHGNLPVVLSDDASFAGFPNLRIIFALFFLSGLAHLAHGFFGIKVHLNHLHHPKIENAMAFMSFFTLLAAAIACPWILIDYRWQIQSVSEDEITVNISTTIIGLGLTAVLFSLARATQAYFERVPGLDANVDASWNENGAVSKCIRTGTSKVSTSTSTSQGPPPPTYAGYGRGSG